MASETSKTMVKAAYDAISDKKGYDITVIDISEVSVIADYFVIATADNIRQVDALSDAVEDKMAELKFDLRRKEGVPDSGWVLLDYNDIIVHVFDKDQRLFYDLERIWSDGKKVVDVNEI
ncbi:ribosome silencing factor [Oribacterium sp. WCC10]|uniref:ribosome silencing factor n=1 Tax=Oribacterium sp. WCC10 TaxID=1855343 RepID=UPI0008F4030D|nr:ribosome silencing factor [Oribacterium sp. WCC10]SFG08552.1 ribosome-associated protein [Oribacterium sp. WCC10]